MNPIDTLAIHEVLARSTHGLDERNLAIIEACFTVDAIFELNIKGAPEIPPFVGRGTIMKLMSDSMNAHTEDRRHVIWIPILLATLHFQYFYFWLQYAEGFALTLWFWGVPVLVDLCFLIWGSYSLWRVHRSA